MTRYDCKYRSISHNNAALEDIHYVEPFFSFLWRSANGRNKMKIVIYHLKQ